MECCSPRVSVSSVIPEEKNSAKGGKKEKEKDGEFQCTEAGLWCRWWRGGRAFRSRASSRSQGRGVTFNNLLFFSVFIGPRDRTGPNRPGPRRWPSMSTIEKRPSSVFERKRRRRRWKKKEERGGRGRGRGGWQQLGVLVSGALSFHLLLSHLPITFHIYHFLFFFNSPIYTKYTPFYRVWSRFSKFLKDVQGLTWPCPKWTNLFSFTVRFPYLNHMN